MTRQYAHWRKSRYSEPNGHCVEVSQTDDGAVGLRDSQQSGSGPVLEFSRAEWTAFVDKIRAHEFDK